MKEAGADARQQPLARPLTYAALLLDAVDSEPDLDDSDGLDFDGSVELDAGLSLALSAPLSLAAESVLPLRA